MSAAPPVRSLRGRILALTLGGAVLGLATIATFTATNRRMRTELASTTRSVMAEQVIADAILSGVMRQLTTMSSVGLVGDSGFRAEFDAAGAAVYDGLRTYLFRDLAPAERAQMERVKEFHEQLEVGAVRAAQLMQQDDAEAAEQARHEVMRRALGFLTALEGFVRMREGDVRAMASAQEATFRRLRWFGVAATLVFVVLLPLLLAQFLRRRVSHPLDALAEAAMRIGRGELATRVPTHYDFEFQLLAARFNEMAGRLASAQADVVQAEKLGALGRMTAGIAHELNNPLASVLGYSELLVAELREGKTLTPARAEDLVQPIVREATRARQLIRGLLQFSRRAGSEMLPVSLRAAMQAAVDLCTFVFEQQNLRLDVDLMPDVTITAEPQQLQNVFLNIMNNALDALRGQANGRLHVTAMEDSGTVVLTFQDNGPGLADPDRIFEPFYTTKEAGEGTGLGLALVQRSIETFGGAVRGENASAGGARFTIRLPVAATPAVRTDAAAPVHQPTPVASAGQTVLVVEDEPHLQHLSRRLLERLGVRVLLAASAAEARALLANEQVDAIVSDVKMPGESGVEFYAWVEREHPALAPRFLFVTGDIHAPELAAFAAERPDALILKPFELDDYLQRVRAVLATT